MLRRGFSAILLLGFVLLCNSCFGMIDPSHTTVSAEELDVPIPFVQANYNNLGTIGHAFYAQDDWLICEDYTSSEPGVVLLKGNQRAKLIPQEFLGEEPFVEQIQVHGNRVYISTFDGDELTRFYAYDFVEYAPVALFEIQGAVLKWMVHEDYVAFSMESNQEDLVYPLFIYMFDTQKLRLIGQEIEDFGIVDGELRYVTFDGDYHLQQYDLRTGVKEELCRFEGYSIKIDTLYQFTKDRLVIRRWDSYEEYTQTEWMVVDIATGDSQVYTLPHPSYTFICGDRYAYIMTYQTEAEDPWWSLKEETHCPVYRADLATGEYRALPITAKDVNDIYVASDDLLYILHYDFQSFMRSTTVVTAYTVSTNTYGTQWVMPQ